MQLHFLFSTFQEETLPVLCRPQKLLTCNSSSLGGCFGHRFSSPLCGTGCVPPFWLGMRAAVLMMKGLFNRLPLLSSAESGKQRDPHQKQKEGVDVSLDLSALTQTSTDCSRSQRAAPVVISVVAHISRITALSVGRCVNSLKLTCKPVTSHKKSQSE